jgi:phage/plasmid-associated DNA primase
MTPSEFIVALFGGRTEADVFINVLGNDGGGQITQVVGRQPEAVDFLVAKHDVQGLNRGLFFAVSTLKSPKRTKENVAEIHLLHQDIDLKDVEEGFDEVVRRTQALPCPPSVLVNSGNGVHAYWLLNEALGPDAMDGVEALLRRLADHVGGDTQCCEVSRLMRLPGTHNSKRGEWKEVEVLDWHPERLYDVEQIEEMLDEAAGPVIKRKPRALSTGAQISIDNPFLKAADAIGINPPLDVEAELAAMTHGDGHHGVHATQVRCTASLLSQGVPIEEVVDRVLYATERAAPSGEVWNWKKERIAIHRMCETWLQKHPPPPVSERAGGGGAPPSAGSRGGSTVVDLKAERVKREKAQPAQADKEDKTPKHIILAKTVIGALELKGEPLMTVLDEMDERELWRYRGGLWARKTSIDMDVQEAADSLKIHMTNRLRSEVRGAVLSDLGIFKMKREVRWDEHGYIPAADCLVDWRTGDVYPYQPKHYATWALPHAYDPGARCPMWEAALDAFFRDKPAEERVQYARLIQEVAGAALLTRKPRGLARALILHGPQNAGKSQVLHVLQGLLSTTAIAQPLSSLEGEHGTVPFAYHRPWVLHEAFNQAKWVMSDKTKQLITQEQVLINIKRGAQFLHVYRGSVFWATNHPPTFRDASQAIVKRLLTVPCNAGFDDRVPEGIAAQAIKEGFSNIAEYILAHEGPGLLNWAIEGLRRAYDRGQFDPPESMAAVEQAIYDDSNPVAEFVRDYCVFDPDRMCRIHDWQAAFKAWWVEQRGDRDVPAGRAIGVALANLGDSRIGLDKKTFRTNTSRYYGGIVLSDEGLDYWKGASAAALAKGLLGDLSKDPFEVNKAVPEGWDEKVAVRRMRLAHEARKTPPVAKKQEQTICHPSADDEQIEEAHNFE